MTPATIAALLNPANLEALTGHTRELAAMWTLAGLADAQTNVDAERRRLATRRAHADGCAQNYTDGYVAGLCGVLPSTLG